MTHLSYVADVVTADDLVTQWARASAAMVLTYFSKHTFWSQHQGLIQNKDVILPVKEFPL